MTNDPQKLADTIVHLAHQNAGLSMEVGILKTEIFFLNETIDELREELDDVLFDGEDELPPSRTNPDDDEWGDERDDCEECGKWVVGEGTVCDDCLGHKPTTYMVDPPSGSKYGFPKIYKCWPEEKEPPANLDWWLVKNGYPEHEIRLWQNSPNYGCVPCRVWKYES